MKTIDGVKMPRRSTKLSAGYDFFSPEEFELRPGEWTMIDTGVSFDGTECPCCMHTGVPLPDDGCAHTISMRYPAMWYMALFPKSGLSTKYGFRIRNVTGIIDMDYRDTIKAMVTVDEPYTLRKDEKYLQGIFMPFGVMSGEIKPTEERKGGHGSTGRF